MVSLKDIKLLVNNQELCTLNLSKSATFSPSQLEELMSSLGYETSVDWNQWDYWIYYSKDIGQNYMLSGNWYFGSKIFNSYA